MADTKKHVLLVDQPDWERLELADLIRSDGYQVTEVNTARDALSLVAKGHIDLVVTELMAPNIHGWDVLEHIKQTRPQVRVVVMTRELSEAAEKILADRRADGYLVKPVLPERVRVLFRALLEPENLGYEAEVVVVEPDAALRDQIVQTLSERGLQASAFSDQDEAVRYIRNGSVDLIITELDLRPDSGLDLCRTVRFTRGIAFTPILLLMDTPSRQVIQKALRFRVNGILAKPFTPEALGKRAIGLLRQAQMKQKRTKK